MELLSRQLGLESRITWHGWCGREVVNQLYRRCFAVVFPSIWPEPAGLVTLEAYSQYRPIIASSTGGIPEYIRDGKTGLLIQPNNVDALASTIQDLSINFEKSKVIGETGYSYLIEKYLIDVHMNRLKEIYEKVIATFREKSM
jgi:glycosyltransferase involved in cell wall biosynthesis